jgi:pimeloyl-ACP methyl ester carboxylesterase
VTAPTMLRHGRIDLALHEVRSGSGLPLLMLHGLGESTGDEVPARLAGWSGPIWGLDFTGHGRSTVPLGGGYTAEILLADADHALRHLGEATVVGRGLGSWIAMLLAGAHPDAVRGAVLTDGPGLIGGGVQPGSTFVIEPPVGADRGISPDPFALVELARDVRPPDYAARFVRFVVEGSPLDEPIVIASVSRPEWIEAVAGEPGVAEMTLDEALQLFGDG